MHFLIGWYGYEKRRPFFNNRLVYMGFMKLKARNFVVRRSQNHWYYWIFQKVLYRHSHHNHQHSLIQRKALVSRAFLYFCVKIHFHTKTTHLKNETLTQRVSFFRLNSSTGARVYQISNQVKSTHKCNFI